MRNLLQTFLVGIQPLSCTHDLPIDGGLGNCKLCPPTCARAGWSPSQTFLEKEHLQWFQTAARGHIISKT